MKNDEEMAKVESSVDQAIKEDMRGKNRGNWLYDGKSVEKAAIVSKTVANGWGELMTAHKRGSVLRNDVNEVVRRTEEYINGRIAAGQLPTVEGWAVALGIGRRTLQRWLTDGTDGDTVRFLRLAKDYFADVAATAAMGGQINPIPWIFYSKNMYEYADKVEVAVEPKTQLGAIQNQEDIVKRYALDVPIDDE